MKTLFVSCCLLATTQLLAQTPFEVNKKFGLKDNSGKVILEPSYDFIYEFKDGLAQVLQGGKMGLVTSDGKELLKPAYKYISRFTNGLAQVKTEGKYGLINSAGKILVLPKYDYIDDFNEGIARVELNEKYGLITDWGDELVSPKYDNIGDFENGICFVRNMDHQKGFKLSGAINRNGKEIIPVEYAYLQVINESLLKANRVMFENGIITSKNEIVIPLKYTELPVGNLSTDIVYVVISGKFGLVSSKGTIIAPAQYEELYKFMNGFAMVKRNGKMGYINTSGKEVIPCQYDQVSNFESGIAKVKLNGQEFKINTAGNKVNYAPLSYFIAPELQAIQSPLTK